MKRNKIYMALSQTELSQLLAYTEYCDSKGWYYGNKKQFEVRHQQIRKELENALAN